MSAGTFFHKNKKHKVPQVRKGGDEMTIATFRIVAMAAGLLLAISGPGDAAQRQPKSQTRTKSTVESQSPPAKSGASAIRPYSPSGTSAYPWGPGYNFPYPDRPYGDPGHW
jgi:hypothetical protein